MVVTCAGTCTNDYEKLVGGPRIEREVLFGGRGIISSMPNVILGEMMKYSTYQKIWP